MEPNKENIKKWVDALRSGNYKQCREQLSNGLGYCCLGVACEVAIAGGLSIEKTLGENRVRYDGTGAMLPQSVRNWFGFYTNDVPVKYAEGESTCVGLNDASRLSFAEIADVVEATYLSV